MTLQTEETQETRQLNILFEGDPPYWTRMPIAVKIALDMQDARGEVATREEQIEAVRQANGLSVLEDEVRAFRDILTDLAIQMAEACGVKTVVFGCGKVQLREASTSYRYDAATVNQAVAALSAIMGEMEQVLAVEPILTETEEDNPELAAFKRVMSIHLEGLQRVISKLAASQKESSRGASVALK